MTRFGDLSVIYFRIIIATRRAHTRYGVMYNMYFVHTLNAAPMLRAVCIGRTGNGEKYQKLKKGTRRHADVFMSVWRA